MRQGDFFEIHITRHIADRLGRALSRTAVP